MIANAKELAAWVEMNAPPPDGDYDILTWAKTAARWFVSVQLAHAVFEERLKDIAAMIQDGVPFAGPVDDAFIDEWLAEGNTGDEDELLIKLRRHFGLPIGG